MERLGHSPYAETDAGKIAGYVKKLLRLLLTLWKSSPSLFSRSAHMNPNIEAALIYISLNFRHALEVKNLATIAHMSEFHFHRVFKKETQTTPQKYIEKLRLEHAAHVMALQPGIKKIHLAFESGFQSPSSFNRAFKKHFGYSPTTFLRIRKENSLIPDAIQEASHQLEPIDIIFLSKIPLTTHLVTAEDTVIQDYLSEKIHTETKILYGVYLDAPFHMPIEDCRYLIGTSPEKNTTGNYVLESGYYLRIPITGTFHQNSFTILAYHQKIERSGYYFPNPVGFEKFKWGTSSSVSYAEARRELFIPIAKQKQDL